MWLNWPALLKQEPGAKEWRLLQVINEAQRWSCERANQEQGPSAEIFLGKTPCTYIQLLYSIMLSTSKLSWTFMGTLARSHPYVSFHSTSLTCPTQVDIALSELTGTGKKFTFWHHYSIWTSSYSKNYIVLWDKNLYFHSMWLFPPSH